MTPPTTLAGTAPIVELSPVLTATGHYHTEKAGTITLTDTAVVFQAGDNRAVFPYSRIDMVAGGRGLFYGSIDLTVGGKRERLSWIEPNDAAPALVAAIADRISR